MFFPLVACSYIICRVNNTLEVLLPDSEIVSHVLEREAVSAFSRMWLRLLYYNVVLFLRRKPFEQHEIKAEKLSRTFCKDCEQ